MKLCKVLVVEDSADLRRILRIALEDTAEGYRMVEAGTIAKGRRLLISEQPDILLLDAELPDGSGFDFCREVRMHSDIPILLSSGLSAKERIAEGYGAGCNDYLIKPYLLDTLLECLDRLGKAT